MFRATNSRNSFSETILSVFNRAARSNGLRRSIKSSRLARTSLAWSIVANRTVVWLFNGNWALKEGVNQRKTEVRNIQAVLMSVLRDILTRLTFISCQQGFYDVAMDVREAKIASLV